MIRSVASAHLKGSLDEKMVHDVALAPKAARQRESVRKRNGGIFSRLFVLYMLTLPGFFSRRFLQPHLAPDIKNSIES